MTDVSRDGRDRRPWWVHLIAAAVLLGVFAVACALALLAWFVVATNCPGYDGEGITYAPASPRGRIACSGDGVRAGIFVPPVLLLAALALVVWVVGWILRSRLRWFCAALALLLLAPVGVLAALGTLPADCSKDQWAEHGAEGCERDREAR